MATLEFELITPEGILIDETIDKLVAMTEVGEIAILPNHAELKSKLKIAPLRYKKANGKEELVAVLAGILEVNKNKITVLTDFAEKSSDIDATQAHKAAEKAKAELDTLRPDAKNNARDLLLTEVLLQKELLRIQTAQMQSKSI